MGIKIIYIMVVLKLIIGSHQILASNHAVNITIKDLSDPTIKTSQIKICTSADKNKCMEKEITYGKENNFEINSNDALFSSIFDEQGFLKNKSIIIYVKNKKNFQPCNHVNDKDKQFYPSEEIPDGLEKSSDASSIEVYINKRMWLGNAIACSLRYRDEKGNTKLAIMAAVETIKLCDSLEVTSKALVQYDDSTFGDTNNLSYYHYNGFIPSGHLLVKGNWDEEYKKFTLASVSSSGTNFDFVAPSEFCKAKNSQQSIINLIQASILIKINEINALKKKLEDINSSQQVENVFSAIGWLFSRNTENEAKFGKMYVGTIINSIAIDKALKILEGKTTDEEVIMNNLKNSKGTSSEEYINNLEQTLKAINVYKDYLENLLISLRARRFERH